MRNRILLGVLVVGVVGGVAFRAGALTGSPTAETPPRVFPYQGYIEDMSGPINGVRAMTFFITDAPTQAYVDPCDDASGCRWEEPQDVTISNGYFSVRLGEDVAFPSTLFEKSNLFVRVRIAEDEAGTNPVTLDGAQQLLATPYAITAQVAPSFRVQDELSVGGGAGQELLTITAGKIGSTSNVITIDPNSDGSDPASGTVSIGGALMGLNGAIIVGNAAVTGSLNVSGDLLDYDDCGPAETAAMTCGASASRVCVLAMMRHRDDTAGDGNWHECKVFDDGTNWVLAPQGTNTVCHARCITW